MGATRWWSPSAPPSSTATTCRWPPTRCSAITSPASLPSASTPSWRRPCGWAAPATTWRFRERSRSRTRPSTRWSPISSPRWFRPASAGSCSCPPTAATSPRWPRRSRSCRTSERRHVVAITDLSVFIRVAQLGEREFEVPMAQGGLHAGEWETSMLLAIHPELVHMDRAEAGYVGDPQEAIAGLFEARGRFAVRRSARSGIRRRRAPSTAAATGRRCWTWPWSWWRPKSR